MWKAYTREKAARPGLGLAAMIVAFVGTLALAQWQIGSSKLPRWESVRSVGTSAWPMTFDLPAGFDWKEAQNDTNLLEKIARKFTDPYSELESVAFTGSSKQISGIELRVEVYRTPGNPLTLLDGGFGPPDGRLKNCDGKGVYWGIAQSGFGLSTFMVMALPQPGENYWVTIEVSSDGTARDNSNLGLWVARSIRCN